jgi:hypothetical protein
MNGAGRIRRAIRRAAGRLLAVMREMDYSQRRVAVLTLAPDRYAAEPHRAPDTYREFLARTTGPMLREPSSRARLAGRRVG